MAETWPYGLETHAHIEECRKGEVWIQIGRCSAAMFECLLSRLLRYGQAYAHCISYGVASPESECGERKSAEI